jgi:hypothetical protein
VYQKSAAVRAVITSNEDFAPELRAKLLPRIAEGGPVEELAIAKDTGKIVIEVCYLQEGDSALLCSTTYGHWIEVLKKLNLISNTNVDIPAKQHLLPSVKANA